MMMINGSAARCVVVVPCDEHGYHVLASDLLQAGVVIATSKTVAVANDVCIRFAFNQRLRAMPLEGRT